MKLLNGTAGIANIIYLKLVVLIVGVDLENLIIKYADQFGENFPMFLFRLTNEAEIIDIIKGCLSVGKPYKPAYEADVEY